jgi:ceramide glucosyltransferase
MTPLDWLLIAFCLTATSLHIVTSLLAMHRCRQRTALLPAPQPAPLVSILRPVRGLDRCEEVTLGSSFALDYPHFELIFCCADADDPAVSLIRRLIARNPRVEARLLIGNHAICLNPKLNNLVKGWRAAAGDWIVFADSNVLMPRDYVQRLFAGWRPQTGVLCAPPIACSVMGFWAELECAFLNGYQARWQYAADSSAWASPRARPC